MNDIIYELNIIGWDGVLTVENYTFGDYPECYFKYLNMINNCEKVYIKRIIDYPNHRSTKIINCWSER